MTAQVKDVRMGGVRVWELTGDDEKEETEMDGKQEDATYSNKRLQGVVGGLQMEYMWWNLAGWIGEDGLHLYPHDQGETSYRPAD